MVSLGKDVNGLVGNQMSTAATSDIYWCIELKSQTRPSSIKGAFLRPRTGHYTDYATITCNPSRWDSDITQILLDLTQIM